MKMTCVIEFEDGEQLERMLTFRHDPPSPEEVSEKFLQLERLFAQALVRKQLRLAGHAKDCVYVRTIKDLACTCGVGGETNADGRPDRAVVVAERKPW